VGPINSLCECFHCLSFQPVYCIIDGKMKSLHTNIESLVNGHSCDIVYAIPHSHLSEDARPHLCRFAAQGALAMRKRLSTHHMQPRRSKPYCQIVGSITSDWLTTAAQESHHASFFVGPNWIQSGHWACDLEIRTRPSFLTMHLPTKFHHPTFNHSEVIVFSKKHMHKQRFC